MQKNENRPGYMKTKVGWIPEEWEAKRLGEFFRFKNGLNKGKEFFGKGTPIVNYLDVYRQRCIRTGDIRGLVTVNKRELKNYGVRKGDVFFTRTSETIDEIGLSSVMLDDIMDAVFSGFVLRARPINNSLHDQYKTYCFSTYSSRKEIVRKSSYTTRALTNGRFLSEVLLILPSLPEQKAIAEVLECWDKAIKGYEKKIKKKRNIKKGLMQRLLFGEQRLPGFSGEWKEVQLGEIGCIVTGNTPPKKEPENYGGEYCWATAEDFVRKYITDTTLKLSDIGKKQARMLPKGSVLVTCIASIGLNAIARVSLATNQQINAIVVDENRFSNEFVYYQISNYKQHLLRIAGSGAVPILSKSEFKKIWMSFPSLPEQSKIALVLSAADEEVSALERKLATLKEQKHFLLNNLVSGTIRLPEYVAERTGVSNE